MPSKFWNDASASSSDSDDSAEEIEAVAEEPSTKDSHNDSSEIDELFRTQSLPTDASIIVPDPSDGESPDLTREQHRDNLMGALLLDYHKTRVAEAFNAKQGMNVTRDTPEVVAIAQQLCNVAISKLVQADILSATPSSEPGSEQSEEYTKILDRFTLGSVGSSNGTSFGTGHQQSLEGGLQGGTNSLALALRPTSNGLQPSNQQHNKLLNMMLNANRIGAIGSPITSPSSDMILSSSSLRQHSHYDSSFQQLKLLGKGGFGKVYHAHSVFDKKEYAIKKIPLSQRLTLKYQQGGLHELESVLREVQALAQLDHANVVRYHATWIEDPKQVVSPKATTMRPHPVSRQRLIADRPHLPNPRVIEESRSGGIVFGESSRRDSVDVSLPGPQGWSINEVQAKPHDKYDQSTSMHASQIFTDGFAKGSSSSDSNIDDTVCVLHVQMSLYPMTLSQYLAPTPPSSTSPPSSPPRRHCFHLIPSLRILLGILSGLRYVHSIGLIHRDIKPGNIFLSLHEDLLPSADPTTHQNGFYSVGDCRSCGAGIAEAAAASCLHVNPRIGDFGLVAELARSEVHLDVGGSSASSPSKVVGTEYYRPPQPVADAKTNKAGLPIDEKIDVFALGIVFVELLWCCDTSTERLHVLRDLQRGVLPREFAASIDREGHGGAGAGIGQEVADCIKGMIEHDASVRIDCSEVKERVIRILGKCS
ncbi:Eukaryotic translation initiation factor 2-alpha kinase 1 [Cyphellophora attinorum]|uniref:Eukaryotic translation initiation factor 2-alpha kinase 1 n=1 Tax=Cyphellophora attinorum TaxID=1664694 RepID=A0A0N1H9U1_9EURO|nr:Eukaryotic translation initiation factor 2-alpha kinase 1 [Phialophora attinorum]KPI39075.1 Eukaryotic translation initiation factor 2-alpha kinase 1 [Phialophora attinorum]